MAKYNVSIRELLVKTISVEANSVESAKEIAKEKYDKSEVILTSEDFTGDVDCKVYDEQYNPLCDWDENFIR